MLQDCWQIKNCGRQRGGSKVIQLGECVASVKRLGKSCWAVAGTLCGGVVQGTAAQKEKNCMGCVVYKDYNRVTGAKRQELLSSHMDEQERYLAHIKTRSAREPHALNG